MLAIASNPGFPLLAVGLLVLALPAALRAPAMALGALGSLVMLFAPPFGASQAIEQLGVVIVAARIDALSQLIGFALVLIALMASITSPTRRGRGEDAALALHLGAAATAVFAGDLVSFLAAAELCALTGGWLVLSAGGQAGLQGAARYLMWQAPGSIALLAGCAFVFAENGSSLFGAAGPSVIGEGLMMTALFIRIGAPLTHPWVRDAAAAVSPGAMTVVTMAGPLVALYGLSRAFTGEPILALAGLGMIAMGALYALLESDLRRAFAGLTTLQMGACLVAAAAPDVAGVGAAGLLAFTATIGLLTLGAALSAAVTLAGTADARTIPSLGAALPVSASAACIGAASLGAAPILAGGVGLGLTAETIAAAAGLIGAYVAPAFAALSALGAARIAAAAFFAPTGAPARQRSVGGAGMLIGLLLSVFLCLAIGAAQSWLAALAPNPLAVRLPWVNLIDQALAAAAGLAVLGLACAVRLTDLAGAGAPFDVDDFYRGPLFSLLRWGGRLVLRLFAAMRSGGEAAGKAVAAVGISIGRFADRPFRPGAPGLAGALAAAVTLIFLLAVFTSWR
jgi:formate hydrogenlyase subunit 3/multisubunit Na+/H+ antiporter MnhD subunit